MSDHNANGPHLVTFNARFGGFARIGDCAVEYMVDGERRCKLSNIPQEAAEFAVEIGLDHFFVFMPDNKWHRIEIVIEQKGQAE
jgi:hypothetical protein